MRAKVFVDPNVIVSSQDASEPGKQGQAVAWMAFLWEKQAGRVSSQVLKEYYVTVTVKLRTGLPREVARGVVRTLLAWKPLAVDARIMEAAWLLQDKGNLPWWDALLVAAAQAAGCRYLLSEDFQEGVKWGELTVVNPFRWGRGIWGGSGGKSMATTRAGGARPDQEELAPPVFFGGEGQGSEVPIPPSQPAEVHL